MLACMILSVWPIPCGDGSSFWHLASLWTQSWVWVSTGVPEIELTAVPTVKHPNLSIGIPAPNFCWSPSVSVLHYPFFIILIPISDGEKKENKKFDSAPTMSSSIHKYSQATTCEQHNKHPYHQHHRHSTAHNAAHSPIWSICQRCEKYWLVEGCVTYTGGTGPNSKITSIWEAYHIVRGETVREWSVRVWKDGGSLLYQRVLDVSGWMGARW